MNRRKLLRTLASAAATIAFPLRVGRVSRTPVDHVDRTRRRARPLNHNELHEPHDIAG